MAIFFVELFSMQDAFCYLPAGTMQYKGKTIFCNENELAKLPPKIPLKAILKYYYNYPKNAKPKCNIPFATSDFKAYYKTPNIAWLGHSSLFFTYKDISILIDPILNMYASPLPFINRAFNQTKCYEANDFPNQLIVIITHAHFDHLDKHSILSLNEQTKYFICPLKVARYLIKWGIKEHKIIELDWWQGVRIWDNLDSKDNIQKDVQTNTLDSINQDLRDKNHKEQSRLFKKSFKENPPLLQITATPSQHNSARIDGFNRTLWASFVIEFCLHTQHYKKVFISGDGGYYTHFKRIGELFCGFDLACLESGQFNEAWCFSHSFPHEICNEAIDLQTKMVLPIHWCRFVAGSHAWNEVVDYLYTNLHKIGISCVVPIIGELYPIGTSYKGKMWWNDNNL